MKLAMAFSCILILGVNLAGAASAPLPAFYGDPPDAQHPWAVHDPNRPQPQVVAPGLFSTPDQPGQPPSDAIVLFDGKDLSAWMSARDGGPAKWLVQDGLLQVNPSTGDIRTKAEFGDCQLHVEWAAPSQVTGNSQDRGNSGVFLMGLCENPGPRQLQQPDLRRWPRGRCLWRQSADGKRFTPARTVPGL